MKKLFDDLLGNGGARIHFAGICGIGMAGLAYMLSMRGHSVSGCDLLTGEMARWLQDRGIAVWTGHDPAHLSDGVDLVVRSSAVPETDPEIEAARRGNVPVVRRGELLAWLMSGCFSVAVCGTHGKTTTSSFTAQLLKSAGRGVSWCIGGDVPLLGGVAGECLFDDQPVLVAEADESDGTLSFYRPAVTVVTNIEYDHMEHFSDEEEFRSCFVKVLKGTGSAVVYCADDPVVCRLVGEVDGVSKISYGFSECASVRAVDLVDDGLRQRFRLQMAGGQTLDAVIPVPGRHNVLNALAAFSAALQCGVEVDVAVSEISKFDMPKRRLETVYSGHGVTVLSDYAHHPTEIAALLGSVKMQGVKRKRMVYQPHRYSRTLALGKDFPAAFEGVDELVLVPVYPASEKPIEGGCIQDLYSLFRSAGRTPILELSLERAWLYFRASLRPGDLLMVTGAGDVENIAFMAKADLAGATALPGVLLDELVAAVESEPGFISKLERDRPVGRLTTCGVGGTADIWADLENETDLRTVMRHTEAAGYGYNVFGGGSNMVVPDAGVRGVSLRLKGADFRKVAMSRTGDCVVAGAGLPTARLAGWLADNGIEGYEFMADIPGCLGGAIRMNAGRCGCETGPAVIWIRCLRSGGEEYIVHGNQLQWFYRGCSLPEDAVIVEAGLSCSMPVTGSESLAELGARRGWMKGVRCAGSIFRNPPDDSAGRLLDSVGLKGSLIGGAMVSDDHANVVIAGEEATASDIIALVMRMHERVYRVTGIDLKKEVRIL